LEYVENNVEEYREVVNGKRNFKDVSEQETSYKAVSGSNSSVVEEVQRQLQALGYTSQYVTGRYDDATFNNVLYFQITNGLEATGWLDEETVKAINKQELEIAEAKATVTTQDFVEGEKPDNLEYAKKSLNQVVLGNFTDDVTFIGTAVTVAAAFTGVDLALDVRDITADFVKWEWTWPHTGQTALDAIALVPVVGVLKHTDEVVLLVKSGNKVHAVTKQAGDVVGLVKYADDAADVGKHVAKYGDDFGKMGVYVKNPGVKVDWSLNIEHASNRMESRGLTKEMVEKIVDSGKALSQNNGQKIIYITKELGTVVVDAITGKLVTVWSVAEYDENMLKIVKSLFGE